MLEKKTEREEIEKQKQNEREVKRSKGINREHEKKEQ